MGLLANIASGLRALTGRTRVEREMDEELSGFIDASTADKHRSGMSPEQAARAARVEMGSTNAVKHRIRSAGWETAAENLWQDLRYSVRMLAKSPAFTLVAIVSLALGIGANTAIFTLINGVLLKQLPVRAPKQLVSVGKALSGGVLGGVDMGTADLYPYDFARQLEKQPGPFEGIFSYNSRLRKVGVQVGEHPSGQAAQMLLHLVSGNYFGVLGVPMFMGRSIQPSDADAPGRNAVVVVSYHYWRETMDADAAAVGKVLTINGVPCTVVGVAPAGFYGIALSTEPPELWAPLTMQAELTREPSMLDANGPYWLHLGARRAAGYSLAQQQWLNTQVRSYVLAHEGAQVTADRRKEIERIAAPLVTAASGVSSLRANFEGPLLILMGVVVLVLLVACANLANFLLAKAAAREREISTRLALGSSRTRIVRQILMEALLLSAVGGVCGLVLAWVATRALIDFVAAGAAYTSLHAAPDISVLAFTLGVSLLTGLLFGLAPALRVARSDAAPALNANARTSSASGGSRGRLLPRALVVSQVTVSVVLLAGAGLFLRSLTNLEQQSVGFNRTHLLLVNLGDKFGGIKPAQLAGFYQKALDRMNALPGVSSAAFANTAPMSHSAWTSSMQVQGYVPAPKEDRDSILERVTPGYFETAGIPIVQGRALGREDAPGGLKAVEVNLAWAEHYFPRGGAVGHQITLDDDTNAGPWTIVGVAANTRYLGPREEPQRQVYFPVQQLVPGENSYAEWLQVRTAGDPDKMTGAVRAALAQMDPSLPVLRIESMADLTDRFVANDQLISRLSSLFSALAVLLAGIGLYGVMSYSVVRRTNEIGIRIALGAQTGNVLWMVLRESLVLLGFGLALGLPLALGGLRLVQSQLYELSASDPVTLAGSILIIAAITLLAAWLPARRAARVDPMVALRCE
ncbi:MAG TPA: ABC transporter permease [Terracidiphilus sp.]|jgi:predicted permease